MGLHVFGRFIILSLAILALSPAALEAAIDQWTPLGAKGGTVWIVAVDSTTNPKTVYAGTNGGVFTSRTAGDSWEPPSTYMFDVVAMAIDTTTSPPTVYAASGGAPGLWKSTNRGANWTLLSTGVNTGVFALAVAPVTGALYAGTNGAGVRKSTDGGASWTAVNTGLTDSLVRSLAIDPLQPDTVYAGTCTLHADQSCTPSVFKTTNGGGLWSGPSAVLGSVSLPAGASVPVRTVALVPGTNTVYAGTQAGMFRRTNDGLPWELVTTPQPDVWAIVVDPSAPLKLYAALSSPNAFLFTVYNSTDGGVTWNPMNTGLAAPTVWALALAPQSATEMYAGTNIGVWKTLNAGNGANWIATAAMANSDVSAIAIDPVTPTTIHLATSIGAFKSTNEGATWIGPGTGLAAAVALAIDPTTPTTLYAGAVRSLGGSGGGVFKSTDGGGNWTPVGLTNLDVTALAIDPATPTTLYAAASGDGVFKSTDGGANWAPAKTGLTNLKVTSLAIDPLTPTTLYAGTSGGGIFKSIDGAASWAAANGGLTSGFIRALAIDPVTPDIVYAATDGAGVFKTTNGGGAWAAANTGLTNPNVRAIAIDPRHPTIVYAGAAGGVFGSGNSGESWTSLNLAVNVNSVKVATAALSTVFVGTQGRSLFSIQGVPGVVAGTGGLVTASVRLTVVSGGGLVTSNPPGIECGSVCSATFPAGTVVTLRDSRIPGWWMRGWSGAGCVGVMPCTITLTDDTAVTASFIPRTTGNLFVFAAVLPASRSVHTSTTATAFATIINTGPDTALACMPWPRTDVPMRYAFQTTDPATNQLVGTPNTPVDIAPGFAQSFVFAFTPSQAAFPSTTSWPSAESAPVEAELNFECANGGPDETRVGLNTLLYSASATPIPDIVALGSTLTHDGIVNLPAPAGTAFFGVATVNVGLVGGTITASTELRGVALPPMSIVICQVDVSGACLNLPSPEVTLTIGVNETPAFAVFVTTAGPVPFLPALNRIFVRFRDAAGVTRGATSVAVRTP